VKILQLGKFYFPAVGGMETVLKNVCESLSHRVEFQVLVAGTQRHTEHEQGTVGVTRVACFGTLLSCPVAPAYPLWARKLDVDLFHVHLANPLAELSALLANPEIPVIAHFHSDVIRPIPRPIRLIYSRFLHSFYRRATCIVVPSRRHIEISAFVPTYRDKCKVVPYGIPLSRFALTDIVAKQVDQLRDGLPRVLFVGRLVHYKGVEFLIRAMENVKAQLWIVGTGPLEIPLKALARDRGVADRITFVGHVSDDDLIAYYHACDLVVLPSITNQEMFGLVQLEAMACCKPVVSTDLPTGVSWVNRHGKTGYCVAPKNVKALSQAVARLLDSRERREDMGHAARLRVEQHFTSEKMAEAMFQIYQEALDKSYRSIRELSQPEPQISLS
jgi:rhamnosyl/mannosyltransferase